MTGLQDEAKNLATVTVVCERHGLRYNPQIHSGCVRCRKEAGEVIGGAPKPAPTAARPSVQPGGSIVAALAVTLLLLVISSGIFYGIHKAAWESQQEARERWMKEGAANGLTPEQIEVLKQLEQRSKR